MRILHGPYNIGNQPWALSRAERREGHTSEVVIRTGTWLKYPADKILYDDSASNFQKAARNVLFGFTTLFRYNVLHYYFGLTFLYPGYSFPASTLSGRILNFMTTVDLRIAKWLGIKRFMTLQGCDVRLASEGHERNEWTMCAQGRCSAYQTCLDTLDDRRRYLIRGVLPFFDRVFYLNPELGHVVPNGQFLPYANVEIEKFDVTPPSLSGRPRVLHAPSDGSIKGTPMILEALEKLKSRYDFELILVQNKTHEEALALYRSADIAIDQILAGWYGGFAVEMMAMGKPIACYIRDIDMDFVDGNMKRDMPIFRLDPGNLVESIAAIFEQRSQWQIRGQQSRAYVEKWHNPEAIAKAMLAAYQSPNSNFTLNSPA